MPARRKCPLVIEADNISIRPTYRFSPYYNTVPGVSVWERLPVQIVTCPVGHFWARINSNYTRDTHGTPEPEVFCPDHQVEMEITRRRNLSRARSKLHWAWDAQPLPINRTCTNPEPHPDDHAPKAVLPIDHFYLTSGAPRRDGTRAVYVDGRCKRCQIRAANERQKLKSRETRRQEQINYRRNKKARGQVPRRIVSRKVDIALFEEWVLWVKPELTEAEAHALALARRNGRQMGYHIIDAVMTRYGAADQCAVFYP